MGLWYPGASPAELDFRREWPKNSVKWYRRPFLFGSTLFGGRRLEPNSVLFGGQAVYVVFPKSSFADPFCHDLMQTGHARRLQDFREMGAIAIDLPPNPPEALLALLKQRFSKFDISIEPGHVVHMGCANQTWLFPRRNERSIYHVGVVSAASADLLRPAAIAVIDAPGASLFIKTMARSAVASRAEREEVIAGARHDEIVEHALPTLGIQLTFDRGAIPRAFFRVEAPSATIVPSMTQVVRRRDGLFGCRYQVMLRNYRKEPWAVAYVSLWTEREPSQWERHRRDAEG